MLITQRPLYDDETFIEIVNGLLKLEIFIRERTEISDSLVIGRIWEVLLFGIIKESNPAPDLWKSIKNNLKNGKKLGKIVNVWSV